MPQRGLVVPRPRELLFSTASVCTRAISSHGNERIKNRVESLDTGERNFHEIGRRDISLAEQARGLLDGKKSQLGF